VRAHQGRPLHFQICSGEVRASNDKGTRTEERRQYVAHVLSNLRAADHEVYRLSDEERRSYA
jgi:hypothetical protein